MALSDVFHVTPLPDQARVTSSGQIFYPTAEGGEIQYSKSALAYYEGEKRSCSALEEDGLARRVAVIDISAQADLSMEYTLAGEPYSVASAVEYLETQWEEKLYAYCSFSKARVGKVIVYERDDGSFAYVLLMDKYIEGLAVEQYSTHAQTSGYEAGGFWQTFILVEMDAPDHIYYYCDYYSFHVTDMEPIDAILSQEEAEKRVNEVLARYADFTILETGLKYGCYIKETDDMTYPIDYVYKPYWCFVLEYASTSDMPINYLPNVTLFIDAQTGTAYLLDSISYTEVQIAE